MKFILFLSLLLSLFLVSFLLPQQGALNQSANQSVLDEQSIMDEIDEIIRRDAEDEPVSRAFISFNETLRNFERRENLLFVFYDRDEERISEEDIDIKKESDTKKILEGFPVLSLENDEEEISFFYRFIQYKKKVKKLEDIRANFLANKNITQDEKEYLLMYHQLIRINLWIQLEELKDLSFIINLQNLLREGIVKNDLDLPKSYLSSYFTYYAEINIQAFKISSNVNALDVILVRNNIYKTESEIYFIRAIRLNQANVRALFRFSINNLVENRNDYFFTFRLINNLNNILENRSIDQGIAFISHLILANTHYIRNDLSKSWQHLFQAEAMFPKSRIVEKITINFKNREKNLFRL